MKTPTLLLAVFVLGIGLMTTAHSQEDDAKEAVRGALEEARTLVAACQMDAYANLWDGDATIFISSGNPLMPIAEHLNIWRGVCVEGGGILVELKEEEIKIYGLTALATGMMVYTFTTADQGSYTVTDRFTMVLRETQAGWKIVHAHGSELGLHSAETN